MYVFRIHIRPSGGTADVRTTFDYCLKNGLLGVGWRTNSWTNTKDWNDYFNEASQLHDNLQICKYIHKWVSEGDLVWTRDSEGQYYLARVTSGWEYWASPEAKESDIDIANIFRCDLKKVEIDDVPGKIVACFRATRTIQEVADNKAKEYSKHLWNSLSQNQVYQIDKAAFNDDIFMMLDDEETEDLLFLYLQSKGWYVVPNSRKGDTMSFEYFAVLPSTGEKALTQVKTGDSFININDYVHCQQKIFLFQSKDKYNGNFSGNIVHVSPQELLEFMKGALSWLPGSFQRKWDLVHP